MPGPTTSAGAKIFGDTTLRYGAAGLLPGDLNIGRLKQLSVKKSLAAMATATDEFGNTVAQAFPSAPDITYTLTITAANSATPPTAGDTTTIDGKTVVFTEVTVNYEAANFAEYTITAEHKGTVDYGSTNVANPG